MRSAYNWYYVKSLLYGSSTRPTYPADPRFVFFIIAVAKASKPGSSTCPAFGTVYLIDLNQSGPNGIFIGIAGFPSGLTRRPDKSEQELWGLGIAYKLGAPEHGRGRAPRRCLAQPKSATGTRCSSFAPSGSALGSPVRASCPNACRLSTTNCHSCSCHRDETALTLAP